MSDAWPPSRLGRRFGPLEVSGGALVLGDSSGSHAVLTPEELVLVEWRGERRPIAWDDIADAELAVPTTRFRWPGAATTLALTVAGAFLVDPAYGDEAPHGNLVVTLREGQKVRSPITRHHHGGYWRRSVAGAEVLLRRSIREPGSRSLLAAPERVLDLLSGRGSARR
ncbi:MAG TPA: hypothetical protein VIL55_09530 [Naasia sp.]|jgi:hypothetical protein